MWSTLLTIWAWQTEAVACFPWCWCYYVYFIKVWHLGLHNIKSTHFYWIKSMVSAWPPGCNLASGAPSQVSWCLGRAENWTVLPSFHGIIMFCVLSSLNACIAMYGSAVLFLGLSRGIGSHKYYRGTLQYTMLIFGFSSLCTLRQNIKRHDYCIQSIYLFIITIYFYYYNTMHRYINTHLSV